VGNIVRLPSTVLSRQTNLMYVLNYFGEAECAGSAAGDQRRIGWRGPGRTAGIPGASIRLLKRARPRMTWRCTTRSSAGHNRRVRTAETFRRQAHALLSDKHAVIARQTMTKNARARSNSPTCKRDFFRACATTTFLTARRARCKSTTATARRDHRSQP